MRPKDWSVSVLAGVILGVLMIMSHTFGYLSQAQRVSAASDAEKALSKTLQSHTKWSSIRGEAQLIQYDADGKPHTDVIRVEITQPLKANIGYQASDDTGKINKKWISDGEKIYQVDDQNLSYTESNIPPFAQRPDFMPKTLVDVKNGEIYHHPFEMSISNPVMEYVYPVWFAQGSSDAKYQLLGEESIAERPTWKIDLQTSTDHVTAWIDQDTGVILKYRQESNGQMIVEMEFTWTEFDKYIDEQEFSSPDKTKYHKVENP